MDAQARRRERRAEKQTEWKAANPLSAGVKAKSDNSRPVLSLTRKSKSRAESAVKPIDLTALAEWNEQIERNAEKLERQNRRIWYRDTNPLGNKIHAVQKMRGKSIPVYFD